MGPGGLNFRVRDGNGCDPSGMIAGKLLKKTVPGPWSVVRCIRTHDEGQMTVFFLNSVASKVKAKLKMIVDILSRFMVKPNGRLGLVSLPITEITHPAYIRRSLRRPFKGIAFV